MGLRGAGGVKNFSVGICDGAPSTARSSVLLNLLNDFGRSNKIRGLPSILSLFRNEFSKFNNTRARNLDSFYLITLRYFEISFLP